ncbi:amidase [Congregibacter litoralis]|uniref:Asp-tRNAAsn/Glu-tRNAGln amidotransferase A subunit n=1 Tax=Congregibacter litoralis KT71 TaxID=314285 RepID=A4AD10_9GAMM|nr:amidase [Congregibacter litoralis]EAQ96063.1 Asp-tRNAAsn/Glu-tRNAGln amidotransferase A subunit [Congregibacter litoralis KT71]
MSILYRSAFGLAQDIKAGKLSAVTVLEFYLDRIEQFNPGINAVVALDTDRALERAVAADKAAAENEDWGPLHGVPMTIKDAWCTEGLVTVGGIPERRDFIPEKNAVAVQRLVDAGAIIFGKTNVPFMSADLQSFNEIYDVTNNPWNVERTCGGSSGGAAAALASGLTPLELGSDIGGSIRTPSHFNGVFGHKSSYELISKRGHLPPGDKVLSEPDLSCAGPLATCVDDLEQALALLAGPAPDITAHPLPALPTPSFRDASHLRVAVWADDEFCRVDKSIAEHIESAAKTLENLGAHVDRHARPAIDPQANHENYLQILMSVIGADVPEEVRQMARDMVAAADPDDRSEALLQMKGIAMEHRSWIVQNEIRQHTRVAWEAFFRDYDVLLCPCAHVPAFEHDHHPDMQARVIAVNGVERPYTDVLKWAGLTLNAYLPATAVPLGTTADGLPVGMQIASRYLGDRTTLAVARLLETHHRAFVPPPGYND